MVAVAAIANDVTESKEPKDKAGELVTNGTSYLIDNMLTSVNLPAEAHKSHE